MEIFHSLIHHIQNGEVDGKICKSLSHVKSDSTERRYEGSLKVIVFN